MKKLISIFTTLCFITSVVGMDIAHAITTDGKEAKSIENTISFIPFNLGRVIESKTFEDSRYTIVNVQDLHCHIEAQKNIEQIIDNLQKTYKISAIFVEGGYGEVDTSIFGRVKDEKLRNNIIEGLFEKGRLTGAEYYYLKNDVKTPFYGLEDRNVHEQNLERLSKALNNNERYNEKLSDIKAEIEYLKAKHFSRENAKFTTTFENYKYGRMPMERYYALLRKYIEKLDQNDSKYNSLLSVSSGKYPVFAAYCALLKAGKRVDYNKATFEMQTLVNHLKENLSYNEYNKLSLATAGFSNIDELGLRLPELSKKYGIEINAESSLGQLISYIEASRQINPVEMLNEERRIAEDIRIAFSATPEEIEISFLSDFYIYLEAFLNTKITADDYEFFEKEYLRFEKIYSKYAFKNTLSELKEDISFLTQYYTVNKERNSIFVKNIEKRLDKKSENNLVIVVTGGFHSDGLNKIFSKNRISYISVMPSITQETKSAEENYNSFLAMGNIFSAQTLALALASQAHKSEIAQMMINTAAMELTDLFYDEKNIAFLIQSISEALDEKIDFNFSSSQTDVTLSNGFLITLKNAGGKIESRAVTNEEILNANRIKIAESLKVAVDSVEKISPIQDAVIGVFSPNVSDIVKNVVAIAAKHNLVTGDGLIFDIETNNNIPEIINGLDRDVIRKMPEIVQEAILKAYQRDELANSEERVLARILIAVYSSLGLDLSAISLLFVENQDSYEKSPNNSFAVEEMSSDISDKAHLLLNNNLKIDKNWQNGILSELKNEIEAILFNANSEAAVSFLIEKRAELIKNKPAIEDRNTVYQKEITLIDSIIADNLDFIPSRTLKKAYTAKERLYLPIIKNRYSPENLYKFIYNKKSKIEHRLFAAMYLKAAGNSESFDSLLDEFFSKIKKDSFKVKSSFDLMAMLTGGQMLLAKKDVFFQRAGTKPTQKGQYLNIYKKIAEAVFTGDKKSPYDGISFLQFNTATLNDILHELGHVNFNEFLSDLGISIGDLQTHTLNELFAFSSSELYSELLGKPKTFRKRYHLHRLFRITMQGMENGLHGFPHHNAHYFMSSINYFHTRKGLTTDWLLVQQTIREYFEKYSKEKFEDPVWNEFLNMYKSKLKKNGIEGDKNSNFRLELSATAGLADKLNLSRLVRNMFIAITEMLPSTLLPPFVFVLLHYADKDWNIDIKASKDMTYSKRMKGAKWIFFGTWLFIAAGVLSVSFAGFSPLILISAAGYNVFSHTIYNALRPDAKLSLFEDKKEARGNRFAVEELESFLATLSYEEANRVTRIVLSVVKDDSGFVWVVSPEERISDLSADELKVFELSTPPTLTFFAAAVEKYEPELLETAKMITKALWRQEQAGGNHIFEELKRIIQNDIPATITFVCSANFNRSAISEVFFKDKLKRNNNKNIVIMSAGTYLTERYSTQYPFLNPVFSDELKEKYGVDHAIIEGFQSMQFADVHEKSDFVIVADYKHKEWVLENYPQLEGKVLQFNEIVPDVNNNDSILDFTDVPGQQRANEINLLERVDRFAEYFFKDIETDEKNNKESEAGTNDVDILVEDFGAKGIVSFDISEAAFSEQEILEAVLNGNMIELTFGKVFAQETLPFYMKRIMSNMGTFSRIFSEKFLVNPFESEQRNGYLLFLMESLKNAFTHGIVLDSSRKVYLYVDIADNNRFRVINFKYGELDENSDVAQAAKIAGLYGYARGQSYMKSSIYSDNFEINPDYKLSNGQSVYVSGITPKNTSKNDFFEMLSQSIAKAVKAETLQREDLKQAYTDAKAIADWGVNDYFVPVDAGSYIAKVFLLDHSIFQVGTKRYFFYDTSSAMTFFPESSVSYPLDSDTVFSMLLEERGKLFKEKNSMQDKTLGYLIENEEEYNTEKFYIELLSNNLNAFDRAVADNMTQSQESLLREDIMPFRILKNRRNVSFLVDTVNDTNISAKYRLQALIYLKINEPQYLLSKSVENELQAASKDIKITNSFDYRSVLAASNMELLNDRNFAEAIARAYLSREDVEVTEDILKSSMILSWMSIFDIDYKELVDANKKISDYLDLSVISDIINAKKARQARFKLLELNFSKKIVEKLGLKDGWARAAVVGIIEFLPSIFMVPLVFVLSHYKNSDGLINVASSEDETFAIRLKGARAIFKGTWLFAALGVTSAMLFSTPILWSLLPAIVFNVLRHAYHNIKHIDAKLELGSKEKARVITYMLGASGVRAVNLFTGAGTLDEVISQNNLLRISLPEQAINESLGEYYFNLDQYLNDFTKKIFRSEDENSRKLADVLGTMMRSSLVHRNNLDIKEPLFVHINKNTRMIRIADFKDKNYDEKNKLADNSEQIQLARRTGVYCEPLTKASMGENGYYANMERNFDAGSVNIDEFSLEKRFSRLEEAELISRKTSTSGVSYHFLSSLMPSDIIKDVSDKKLLSLEMFKKSEMESLEGYYERLSLQISVFADIVFNAGSFANDGASNEITRKIPDVEDRNIMASYLKIMIQNSFYEGNKLQIIKDIHICINLDKKEIKVINSQQEPLGYDASVESEKVRLAAELNGFTDRTSLDLFDKTEQIISEDKLRLDISEFNLEKKKKLDNLHNALSKDFKTGANVLYFDTSKKTSIVGSNRDLMYVLYLPKTTDYWKMNEKIFEFTEAFFTSKSDKAKFSDHLNFMIRNMFVNGNAANSELPIFIHIDGSLRVATMERSDTAAENEAAVSAASKALLYDAKQAFADMEKAGFYNITKEDYSKNVSANLFEFTHGKADITDIVSKLGASGVETFNMYSDSEALKKAISENKILEINFPKRNIKDFKESYYDYYLRIKRASNVFAESVLDGNIGSDEYKMQSALSYMMQEMFVSGNLLEAQKPIYVYINEKEKTVKVVNDILKQERESGYKNSQAQDAGMTNFAAAVKHMANNGNFRQYEEVSGSKAFTVQEFSIKKLNKSTEIINYYTPLNISLENSRESFAISNQDGAFSLVLGGVSVPLSVGVDRFLNNPDGEKAVRIKVLNNNSFEIEEMSGKTLTINSGQSDSGSIKLELGYSQKIADKLGLKDGWLRAVVVGVVEFLPSTFMMPFAFVIMHYKNKEGYINILPADNETYNIRLKGARTIFSGTWLFAALGVTSAMLLSTPILWSLLPAAVFNILRHAYHNIKNPNAKLSLEESVDGAQYDYRKENYPAPRFVHKEFKKYEKDFRKSYKKGMEFLNEIQRPGSKRQLEFLSKLENELKINKSMSEAFIEKQGFMYSINDIAEIMFNAEKQMPGFINVLFKNDDERMNALLMVIDFFTAASDEGHSVALKMPIEEKFSDGILNLKNNIEAFFKPGEKRIEDLQGQVDKFKQFNGNRNESSVLMNFEKIANCFKTAEKLSIGKLAIKSGRKKKVKEILDDIIYNEASKKIFLDIISIAIDNNKSEFRSAIESKKYLFGNGFNGNSVLSDDFIEKIEEILYQIIDMKVSFKKKQMILPMRWERVVNTVYEPLPYSVEKPEKSAEDFKKFTKLIDNLAGLLDPNILGAELETLQKSEQKSDDIKEFLLKKYKIKLDPVYEEEIEQFKDYFIVDNVIEKIISERHRKAMPLGAVWRQLVEALKDDRFIDSLRGFGEWNVGELKKLLDEYQISTDKIDKNIDALYSMLYQIAFSSDSEIERIKNAWSETNENRIIVRKTLVINKKAKKQRSEFFENKSEMQRLGITEKELADVYSVIAAVLSSDQKDISVSAFVDVFEKNANIKHLIKNDEKFDFILKIFTSSHEYKERLSGAMSKESVLQAIVENASHFFSEDVNDKISDKNKIFLRFFSERKYDQKIVFEKLRSGNAEIAFVLPNSENGENAYIYIVVAEGNDGKSAVSNIWLNPNAEAGDIRVAGFASSVASLKQFYLLFDKNIERLLQNVVDSSKGIKELEGNLEIIRLNLDGLPGKLFGTSGSSYFDSHEDNELLPAQLKREMNKRIVIAQRKVKFVEEFPTSIEKIIAEGIPLQKAVEEYYTAKEGGKIDDAVFVKALIDNVVRRMNDEPAYVKLTLPEVEKRVRERGYTGLRKYIYISLVEFLRMMSRPSEKFADMHENRSLAQRERRVQETKIVKAVSYTFGLVPLLVSLALSPLALPVAIGIAVLSAVIGNVIAHSRYLYLADAGENMDKIKQLIGLFGKYSRMNIVEVNSELIKDIAPILQPEFVSMIISSEKNDASAELKKMYIKNLELFYAVSAKSKEFEIRNRIFNVLYDLYQENSSNIDSVYLQDSFVAHFNTLDHSTEDKEISEKLFDIIEYLSGANLKKISKIKTSAAASKNEDLIVSHQKALASILLYGDQFRELKSGKMSYTRKMFKEVIGDEKYGKAASQIFSKEYMEIYKMFSETLFDKFMNEKTKQEFLNFLKSSSDLTEILNYITQNDIPYELGCYFITATKNLKTIYSVFNSNAVDYRHRLYALKTIAKLEYNTEDIMFYIMNYDQLNDRVVSMLSNNNLKLNKAELDEIMELKEKNRGIPVISDEQMAYLSDDAHAFIMKDSLYNSTSNPFSNSIDAEILMISLILTMATSMPDIDIINSIKKMPAVMTFNGDSAENGYGMITDAHGSLVFQDVTAESNSDSSRSERLISFINNLDSFTEPKQGRNIDHTDLVAITKQHYGLVSDAEQKEESAKTTVSKKKESLFGKMSKFLFVLFAVLVVPVVISNAAYKPVFSDTISHYSTAFVMSTMNKSEVRANEEVNRHLSGGGVYKLLAKIKAEYPDAKINNKIDSEGMLGISVTKNINKQTLENFISIEAALSNVNISKPLVSFGIDSGTGILNETVELKILNKDSVDFNPNLNTDFQTKPSMANAVFENATQSLKGIVEKKQSNDNKEAQEPYYETPLRLQLLAAVAFAVTEIRFGASRSFIGHIPTMISAFVISIAGVLIAASINRISVNYKFRKELTSFEDLESFGVQEKDGNISVPVYMINRMPTQKEAFKFKNTGLKINGKSVWASSESKVLVVFAENAEPAQIESIMKNDSRKIQREISKLVKKVTGKALEGELSFDWVNVNTNAERTSFNYDDDGSIRTNLSAEDSRYESEVFDFMTGVRQVRNADTMAAVQNIYYFLDNVKTVADLNTVLSDFQKIGNGQIVLDYSVLRNNLSDSKISDFFTAAHINGIKVIADLRNSDLSSGFNAYRETGFDGVLYNAAENVLSVYDFSLASDRKAAVVEGYADSGQLVKELQKTTDIKILNNSEITAKIATDDRSIIDRIQILKILKGSALLGALKKDRYTSDFVKNAAYNFTAESMTAFDKIQQEELLRLLETKDLTAVKKYLNLADTHAAMIYLDRNIDDNIVNKAESATVQIAFLEGLLEKMLVSKNVIGTIVNKDLEKTLGKALRIQMQSGGKADSAVFADEFKGQVRQAAERLTAKMKKKDVEKMFSQKLQSALSDKINSLAEDAFVKKDAIALATIIELIPAIAEARFNMAVDKGAAQFDVRQIKSLLSAA